MKSISVQLDSLTDLLKKNINNKELLKSKDNFEIVYQKITQEAFKTIHVMIENFNDDFTLKLSYSSLLKQLKTFLSLKPAQNYDEEEEFFSKEFDEVQQFMNNRKPVMSDIDSGQRGDIYKYLYQAENKQKDIEEFMGNANKFNLKGNKKFQLTNSKWKKTLKNLSIITEDIEIQTDLNLQFFDILQKKMPNLFKLPSSHLKSTHSNNKQDTSLKDQNNSALNFEDMIDGIINEQLQEKKKCLEEKKAIIQKQEKQKQAEQKKKQTQKKKKKPTDSSRRNSQLNLKRNSIQGSQLPSLKTKSQFNNKKTNLTNQVNQKSSQMEKIAKITTKKSIHLKSANSQQISTKKKDMITKDYSFAVDYGNATEGLKSIDECLPSFQNFMKMISSSSNLCGVSEEQIKELYQIFRKQISMVLPNNPFLKEYIQSQSKSNQSCTENNINQLSKQKTFSRKANMNTCEKSTNTEPNNFDQMKKLAKNTLNNKDERSKFMSKKSNKSSASNQNQASSAQNHHKKKHYLNKNKKEQSTSKSKNQQSPQQKQYSNSIHQHNFHKKGGYYENGNYYENEDQSNGLPQIYKNDSQKLRNHNYSIEHDHDESIKENYQNDLYNKHLKDKDTKQTNSPQSVKIFNKQNYTLDMYKSKENTIKNRAFEQINLPTLNRKMVKPYSSLHDQPDQLRKSPYLKKIGKKNTIHQSSADTLSLLKNSEHLENNAEIRRSKTNNSYHDEKDEEKIMNQLQKISKQGNMKMNMKNIAMYINYVESIHIRRCGEKCIHLQRFYGFLQRNNIPNRRELSMHKADMNLNVNI